MTTHDLAAPSPVSVTSTVAAPASRRRHPLLWVPSLNFAMGTPMITVSVVAAIMYKNLGASNSDIAFHTGLMSLPWTLKPFWSPLLEMFRSKKFFVLASTPKEQAAYVGVQGIAWNAGSIIASACWCPSPGICTAPANCRGCNRG